MADQSQCLVRRSGISKKLIESNLAQAVASIIVVVISLTVCWLGDDIDYMFRIHTAIWNSSGSFSSIQDFFESQFNHYLHVNGRFVAHTLVQLFCGVLGQTFFSLANGIVWFLFLKLIGTVAIGKDWAEDLSVSATITVVSLLSFITKMMPTTQIGYIWMFTLVLWWWKLWTSCHLRSVWGIILLTILGIIAGNGQEALSIGVCCMLVTDMVISAVRNRKEKKTYLLPVRIWMPALGFIIGTATDCFSPATMQRAGNVTDTVTFSESLLFAIVALRAFYLMLAVWLFRAMANRKSFRNLLKGNIGCIAAILFLLVFDFAIGIRSNRQLFGVELFSIIVLIRILPRHSFSKIPLSLLIGAAIAIYAVQLTDTVKVRKEFRAIEKEYLASDNGVVYRTRQRISSHPVTREIRLFEDITGRFDNDVRHSMMKLFSSRQAGKKVLCFMPEAVRPDSLTGKIRAGVLRERVIKIAPGHFLVITRKNPPVFILKERNLITRKMTTDTVIPPRPTSFLRLTDGTLWRFYELSPDKPFFM